MLGGPPWRDPCSPHTGHCSPGMTAGGRSPAAAVNPGGPQEAWEPDSSPETRTRSHSWNRVRRQLDIVQDLVSLLSSLCAPQPTDTPSVPLDLVYPPLRARAGHAGQSGQCGVQSWLRQAGRVDRPGWPSAIREGPEEQCFGNILLHFPHSKVLYVFM